MTQDPLFTDLDMKRKKGKTPESGLLDFPAVYDTTPVPLSPVANPDADYTGVYTTPHEIEARRVLVGLRDYDAQFIYKDGVFAIVIPGIMPNSRLYKLADTFAHTDTQPPALQTFKEFNT